eukprot:CAMPEP_0174378646 /NCGR_PEP_ID=MMETSP0811_2-20130205/122181_1 /TAXON_ID=73025 ORGANISM="Eutreptiella gymnastica-like, Strain CCMP1594" /NCGR_SAMPLE_ID=MMETSP0811_2 /ASSEMBLY_ACC=CAM_ASM_000667 /LENGTH=291 /DNA_ID=CAMNT_0015530919 /DNA_START=632 /DNA_END=1504 /DNA_ORIENTATION=+
MGQSSALGRWVFEQGFDVSSWVQVCHDPSITLSQHRQAAYLRMLPFLPCVYFEVPDCRSCRLFQGNEQSHMSACVELYSRQCRAVRAVGEWLAPNHGFTVVAVWVTVLLVRRSGFTFWVAVEAETRVSERRASLCSMPGHQVVLLSMSGLMWVSQSSSQSPVYVHARVRHQLSHIVLQCMHERVDGSLPVTDGLSLDLSLSPYAENGPVSAPVPFSLQVVMAWVVRRDPRLAETYRACFHVNLPPRVFHDPSPLEYVLFLSTDNQCMLQCPGQSRRAVVLCGCHTAPAPMW